MHGMLTQQHTGARISSSCKGLGQLFAEDQARPYSHTEAHYHAAVCCNVAATLNFAGSCQHPAAMWTIKGTVP
jgi:hypothetical protein